MATEQTMQHWVEPASVFIVLIYAYMRVRQDGFAFVRAYASLAVLAFAAEDSVVHLYGYYGYGAGWTHFIDRVPLLVALIWPVVIDSSRELAKALLPPDASRAKLALATAFIVLLDASLIEPVSVRAGLWSWTHAGPFAVPWIGVIGWAYFAGWVTFWGGGSILRAAWSVVFVHATLLATYYALFQFVPPIAREGVMGIAAWIVLGLLGLWTLRAHAIERLEVRTVMLRAPGAVFFFGLLASLDSASLTMWVYALAFSVPYVVYLSRWAKWASRPKNIMVTSSSVAPGHLFEQ